MYRIIGADGKEYGPISVDQLKQWIAEGRANAQTRVMLEGTTDWKTLAEFPELAALLTAPTPGIAPGAVPSAFPAPNAGDPIQMINGPATGLLVVAILGFCAQVFGLVWRVAFSAMAARQAADQPWGNMLSGGLGIVSAVIGIVTGGIILFGALKMKKLESYGFAVASSVIAMIPCVSPCCLIGLPIGIWALIVLNKPEVKSAFH